MRRPFVAGNWKMNHVTTDALRFIHALPELREAHPGVEIALFPPLTLIMVLARALSGTAVRVGAQTCHHERAGAFTGDVSAAMIADAGASMVLVGHSERRAGCGETDDLVRRKLRAILAEDLDAVLCIGETAAEHEEGRTEAVLARQLVTSLSGLSDDEAACMTIAYEPVWAIGTGRTATPEVAARAHAFVRSQVREILGAERAAGLRILYGGSVNAENAAPLFAQDGIDGGLVGGASLDFATFSAIVAAADH